MCFHRNNNTVAHYLTKDKEKLLLNADYLEINLLSPVWTYYVDLRLLKFNLVLSTGSFFLLFK